MAYNTSSSPYDRRKCEKCLDTGNIWGGPPMPGMELDIGELSCG